MHEPPAQRPAVFVLSLNETRKRETTCPLTLDCNSNDKARLAAEVCAVTRILEDMNILQYSGHLAVRVPGQDALMVQRRTDSRAELSP